jgi:hypothetical protein
VSSFFFLINFLVGIDNFLLSYLYLADLSEFGELRSAQIELTASAGIKNIIANVFAPTGLLQTVFFTPFRLLIWLILPFPFVFPNLFELFSTNELLGKNWNHYFRFFEQFMRVLSTWFILFTLPIVIKLF